jgi:hypothetical protein
MPETIKIPTPPAPIPGFPSIAKRMGDIPELAIIRRFGNLNALNMLYYQAELSYLENELRTIEKRDYDLDCQDQTRDSCNTDWYYLGSEMADSSKRKQLEVFQKIRVILPKYSRYHRCLTEGKHEKLIKSQMSL